MNNVPAIRGVLSAALTAFDADGVVDIARTVAHAQHLLRSGCDGIAPLGTTGEANSLSTHERRAIIDALANAGTPMLRVVPGTGVCSVPETVELTRHAYDTGVRTVLLLPPFYYPSPSEDGLFEHYARVLEKCALTDLRIMLYHIPQMSGVPITHALIARLEEHYPQAIVGVKDSSGDLKHMRDLVSAFPKLAVFAGADHLLGPLLRAGGAGCITATSNLIAPWLAALFRDIATNAETEQTSAVEKRIAAARALFQRWPQIPALKAALARLSGDGGWSVVRPPWLTLTVEQADDVADAMSDLFTDTKFGVAA